MRKKHLFKQVSSLPREKLFPQINEEWCLCKTEMKNYYSTFATVTERKPVLEANLVMQNLHKEKAMKTQTILAKTLYLLSPVTLPIWHSSPKKETFEQS